MTVDSIANSQAAPAAPRPPLTRASADRLFWRQEGARHWPLWVNGLALWIWLFLVPGETTEESQVLRWSILWTGVLALVLAGDDLRRGIDPLVRGLALDPARRWQFRTLTVLAGGSLFYLAGCIASSERWAWHLWHHVASGPFSGLATTTEPSPFQPWQGLCVLALVALLCCLAAAHFHGMIMGLVYAGGVWLASHGCAGEYPDLLSEWNMTGNQRSPLSDYAGRALPAAVVCAVLAGLAWIIGTVHSARRAPLHTKGQSISLLPSAITLVGALAILHLILITSASRHHSYPAPLALDLSDRTVRFGEFQTSYSFSSLRWWTALAWLNAALFVTWWVAAFRARRRSGRASALKVKPRWLPWLAGVVAVIHLFTQPAQSLRTPAPQLAQAWPHPISNPTITSSQSLTEASENPFYKTPPHAYDVILAGWYLAKNSPELIVLETGTLPVPSAWPPAALTFRIPPTSLWSRPLVLKVGLSRLPAQDGAVQQRAQRSPLRLTIHNPESTPGFQHLNVLDYPLQADFQKGLFKPEALYDTRAGLLNRPVSWGLFLIPQRPGTPPKERPWTEIGNINRTPNYDAPGLRFETHGIRGLFNHVVSQSPLPICHWLLPLTLLAGVLLLHSRLGGAFCLLASLLLILSLIQADATRVRTDRRTSTEPAYPHYQRDFARAKAAVSFFHKSAPTAEP